MTYICTNENNYKIEIMRYTFKEDNNTTWFCTKLVTSNEWLIFAEYKGEVIRGTKQIRKTMTKEIKETFGIK